MDINSFLSDLYSDGVKDIILDTDAYNEIDDQYAIAYAMLSPDKINIKAFCAAPFFNKRSKDALDGMEKSYDEIFKIRNLVDKSSDIPVFRGSSTFMTSANTPVESEAADKIAEIVLNSEKTVYIVAIGAITNVASAILKYPELIEKTAVIWLGGHALHCKSAAEFNLKEDVLSAQVVFDSGIPLLQVPCYGVCSEFLTTVPELEYYLANKNSLCEYLLDATREYGENAYGWSKVIWDVTALAVFTVPKAFESVSMPRPSVTIDKKYAFDMTRPPYVYIRKLNRDIIYADLFRKLSSLKD